MPPQDLNEDVLVYIGYERFPTIFHRSNKSGKADLFAMVPETSEPKVFKFELTEGKTVDVFVKFLETVCDFTVTKEVGEKITVTIQEYTNSNSYIQ